VDKRIVVAQKLLPFSHLAGSKVVLPGSILQITIYPTLILIANRQIHIPLTGPVDDFTVQMDLEKGLVKVWGHYKEGFLRYTIQATVDGSFIIQAEKSPLADLFFSTSANTFVPQGNEKLSLGNHKAQDWDLVRRRSDLSEIFPIWFRLGQLLPDTVLDISAGTSALLGNCQLTIADQDKLKVIPSFINLFNAGFEGILSPRLSDTDFQGFNLKETGPDFKGSAIALLKEGSNLIRSLFFRQRDNELEILPLLPPEFHSGRFINISCGALGTIDIEWSKKTIRRLVFHSQSLNEIIFRFPKELKTFRVCERKNHKGQIVSTGSPVSVQQGISYLFDNFKH
jgi:hypothetical protein